MNAMTGFGVARAGGRVRRQMSVQRALEWAFGVEHAGVEFDELADGPPATDTVWRLMQRGQLGCRVDGGGRSLPHGDAVVIASLVSALDIAHGGRSMALQIAAHARACSVPDWMPDATPRCVPVAWRSTKHGVFAKTEVVGSVETQYRGRVVQHDLVACPVTWAPSAAKISSARRNYLAWWGALLELQAQLRGARLSTIVMTSAMPPLEPWRTSGQVKG